MTKLNERYKRKSQVLDPSLIVIATEGEKTEPEYFECLKSDDRHTTSRVHIEILPKTNSASSPKHVLNQLHDYKKRKQLNKYDTLWMVIDKDRWSDRDLNFVSKECQSNNYRLILSNPCFEIWLLLHLKDLADYNAKEMKSICCNKASLKKKMKELIRTFSNNESIEMGLFMDKVHKAISHAKKLDKHPQDRWPMTYGTRVYLLVESIVIR
jgi:hypothetical protein